MAHLLFYSKPTALNKVVHRDTKIKPMGDDYGFARATNSVILAGVEFSEAAKEYPIVFAKAGESIVPVALLGLRNEENLFVYESGNWDARYIPAFVRRYPFVLAEAGDQKQQMVCIDEAYAGFNEKSGEALFENDEPAPVLAQAIEFLEEYQRQYARTEAFVKRLQDADLLMSLNAKIDMNDGQQFALQGLMAVDEQKLLEMGDEQALSFFRSGELSWLYCHLMSLGCMASLVDKIAKATKVDALKKALSKEKKKPKKKAAAKSRATGSTK